MQLVMFHISRITSGFHYHYRYLNIKKQWQTHFKRQFQSSFRAFEVININNLIRQSPPKQRRLKDSQDNSQNKTRQKKQAKNQKIKHSLRARLRARADYKLYISFKNKQKRTDTLSNDHI